MRGKATIRWTMLLACIVIAFLAFPIVAQDESNIRSVQGVVTNDGGQAVEAAVVQLKDTSSLRIRSFITRDDGSYFFHGLSTNVDYELKAQYQGTSSSVKTLSVFDSRKKAVINLRLESE